jgi:hypothetical protein
MIDFKDIKIDCREMCCYGFGDPNYPSHCQNCDGNYKHSFTC